jgi:hypothetical protein
LSLCFMLFGAELKVLGFRVNVLGLWVEGLRFMFQGLGFRVTCCNMPRAQRVWGLGLMAQGLSCRA